MYVSGAVSALLLWLAVTGTNLAAQNTVSQARLNEDVQLLQRTVGRLRLEVEALRRENEELRQQLKAEARARAALRSTLESQLAAAADERRRAMAAQKSAIINEMRALVRDLAQAAPPSTSEPSTPEPTVVFDDDFPTDGTTYDVKPGDTLSGIATRLGSKVVWIQKANRLNRPEDLKAGVTIFVPQAAD